MYTSKILRLYPFLDSLGLIRVGGRLKISDFSFTKKHPILLPSNHNLIKIIVTDMHRKLLHLGP